MTFHPFTVHYHMNTDLNPQASCEDQDGVAVLALGETLRVFATDAQLAEVGRAIDAYFHRRAAATLSADLPLPF